MWKIPDTEWNIKKVNSGEKMQCAEELNTGKLLHSKNNRRVNRMTADRN